MKTIIFLLQKEFIQIFRNKTMLPIIFILPIVQMLILVFAATLEMQNIKIKIVDFDNSSVSSEIISKFKASPFYELTGIDYSIDVAMKSLNDNSSDCILVIPDKVEKDLINGESANIQLLINSINGMSAGLINSYSSQIIMDVNKNLIIKNIHLSQPNNLKNISLEQRFWYNPGLNYKHYMVPGILVILVTIIGMFLSALNIVREKEMGTIEQINVSPIKKHQFIIGKLIPFLLIGLFDLALGLAVGWLIFDLPFRGSLFVLFSFAFIYLILVLGLGLILSIISETQQQVMFLTFFFILIFILMSGIFTPIETMPLWAQKVNIINPFAYFMKVNRMVLLKGSGFKDLIKEFLYISIYAIVTITLAIKYYRKTV